jgi:hypothetical protein
MVGVASNHKHKKDGQATYLPCPCSAVDVIRFNVIINLLLSVRLYTKSDFVQCVSLRTQYYEGHLKSWWTHLITLSWNFMEVWWWSFFFFSKYLPWQAMHFLQHSTHFIEMCCRPFAASFRRIAEQARLYLQKGSSEIFLVEENLCASKLHRLDKWVVGFLIHFFQAEHRMQLCNADTPLRICSCSAILERVLLIKRL